ncbi:C-terminal binding protein [Halegenticoccus tardaugens]|uniref:C-terminal binding protein n=1 Tax=Halegenticoccus tardaugens TaxID=2071624 RepID=UPI00100B6ECC|nr:C-terminal binding protein [Halegenticoccus tardaugens]
MSHTVVVTDFDFPDVELERELCEAHGATLETAQATTPTEVIEAAAGADALLVQYAPITEAVFDALPDLVVVGRYGVGVDAVDVASATAHGVQVVNVPAYCEDEVSTHAIALLLACVRNVSNYDAEIKRGTWDWKRGRPIHRLRGRTLGFAGFGKIPERMVKKVRGFGLDAVAYDPYRSAEEIAGRGAEKVEFEELLERADAISVHTPLTDETRGLFDADAFRVMKESAVLVNTARGGVVDTDALADALTAGELAGAGLDVLPEEPPEPSPLLDRDDVVLTPHVAWYSEESIEELRRTATRDVLRAIVGERPENLVNPDVFESTTPP